MAPSAHAASADAARTLGRALDTSPLTPMHWRIWWLSAMGVFLDGFDLFIIAVALPLIVVDLQPSPVVEGLIGAAALIGAMVGAFAGGRLTDRYGRKAIYVIDLAVFVAGSLATALAPGAISLLILRAVLGVGVGADYPICAAYVSEFMPARVRGRMLIGAFSFQALGMVAAALSGLLILSLHPARDAWRIMLAVAVIPALAVMVLRRAVPESPRWCIEHGQVDRAARIVADLVPGRRAELIALAARPLPPLRRRAESFAVLFSARYIRRTVLAAGAWFLMDIASYAIGIFTPSILASLAFTAPGRGPIATDFMATEGAAFLDVFLVIGFLLNVWLVDRWGRIRLQALGFAGMALGLLVLARGATMDPAGHGAITIFAGFVLFNVLMNVGPNATTFILPAELFSTEVRASGHGFAAGAAKLGAALGIFLLPVLRVQLGVPMLLALLAGVCVLGLVITLVFHVETRGRSLEELNPEER